MPRLEHDDEKVARYRTLANDAFAQAALSGDDDVRVWYIDIGNSYLKMARHIETSDWRRAIREAQTVPATKAVLPTD
jgi:hypothetical protein